MKAAITPLGALAQRTGCTVLGNLHFKKDTTRGARNATQGSTAFVDVPRVAWGMAKDPDDDSLRVVEIIKSNIGPEGVGRNWRLQFAPVPGLDDEVPYIVPEGAATRSVDDLLRSVGNGGQASSDALQALVLRELESGPKSREYLDEAAYDELGATPDMLYKRGLAPLNRKRIRSGKTSFDGGWEWKRLD